MARNLAALSAKTVTEVASRLGAAVPKLRWSTSEDPVLHIGVGNFARSHIADYTQAAGGSLAGFGIDGKMQDTMRSQDGLYVLMRKEAKSVQAQIMAPFTSYTMIPENVQAAADALASSTSKIWSLTITEKGYMLTKDMKLDESSPAVGIDVKDPSRPKSTPGLLVEALRRRRERKLGGVTIMSCDNLKGNGDVTKSVVLTMARLASRGNDLDKWIESECTFPNSMVDRITPAASEEDHAYLRERGISDKSPVPCEDFKQWIVEDSFVSGCRRPRWHEVGAVFGPHKLVKEYELMKLTLLNGGHSTLAYGSALLGFTQVDKAMSDPGIRAFVHAYMKESMQVLPAISGVSFEAYAQKLLVRFANPAVSDRVSRLCEDGSTKLPNFFSMPLIKSKQLGGSPATATAVAMWAYYLSKASDKLIKERAPDPGSAALLNLATSVFEADEASVSAASRSFLRAAFGTASEQADFVAQFAAKSTALKKEGVRTVLEKAAR